MVACLLHMLPAVNQDVPALHAELNLHPQLWHTQCTFYESHKICFAYWYSVTMVKEVTMFSVVVAV